MARPKKTTKDASVLVEGDYFFHQSCWDDDNERINWNKLEKAAGLDSSSGKPSRITQKFTFEQRGKICTALDEYSRVKLLDEGGYRQKKMAGRKGQGPTKRDQRERAPSSVVTKFIRELQRFEQAWVTAREDPHFVSIVTDYCGDFRSRHPNRPAIDHIMTEFSALKIDLGIYLKKRLEENVRDAIDPQNKLFRDLGSVFEAAGGKLAIRTDQDRDTTKTADEDQPRSPFHSFVESVCKLLPDNIAPTHPNPGAWAIAIRQAIKDRDHDL